MAVTIAVTVNNNGRRQFNNYLYPATLRRRWRPVNWATRTAWPVRSVGRSARVIIPVWVMSVRTLAKGEVRPGSGFRRSRHGRNRDHQQNQSYRFHRSHRSLLSPPLLGGNLIVFLSTLSLFTYIVSYLYYTPIFKFVKWRQ